MKEGKLENRKGKEGLPQMGPTHRGSLAQGQGRLLPRASQAAAAVASMPATPGHLLLPRGHISTPGDAQKATASIPPLPGPPPPLLFAISAPPRSTPEHHRGDPWPPSSSAAATLSRTRAVVVFIAVCKQSKPGAPSPSSSSPSRR